MIDDKLTLPKLTGDDIKDAIAVRGYINAVRELYPELPQRIPLPTSIITDRSLLSAYRAVWKFLSP